MAIPKLKATYTLDAETVRALERMARRWGVSKSEALRRAIRRAMEHGTDRTQDGLEALDRLQRALELTLQGARRWVQSIRAERRAGSERGPGR
jgi:hypothetical protein